MKIQRHRDATADQWTITTSTQKVFLIAFRPIKSPGDNSDKTGYHLWPSAIQLTTYMLKHYQKYLQVDSSVWEMGAGWTALPLRTLASCVDIHCTWTISDGHAAVVDALALATSVTPFLYPTKKPIRVLLTKRWKINDDCHSKNLILASDCLYPGVDLVAFFTAIFEQLHMDGCVLLTFVHRQSFPRFRKSVLDVAATFEFHIVLCHKTNVPTIDIWELKRKGKVVFHISPVLANLLVNEKEDDEIDVSDWWDDL